MNTFSSNNNTLASNSINIDLVITDAIVPVEASLGATIEFSLTVKNLGNDNASREYGHEVDIHISDDEILDDSDLYLYMERFYGDSDLAGGASFTLERNFSIEHFFSGSGDQASLALRDRFLIFEIDPDDDLVETNEENNTLAVPITLNIPDVDLVVTEANVPTQIKVGDIIDLSWTVTNLGTETASGSEDFVGDHIESNISYDSVFISNDEILDDSDSFLGSQLSYLNLEEGESQTLESNFYFDNVSQTGDKYLIFVADDTAASLRPDNEFGYQSETNENNNTLAIPVNVTLPDVDLAITEVNAPTEVRIGELFDLSWTVTNLGTDTAQGQLFFEGGINESLTGSQSMDSVFISEDEILDDTDESFSEIEILRGEILPLAGGDEYTIDAIDRHDVIIDSSFGSGDRFLIFATDSNNDQVETNEDNNTVVVPLKILEESPETMEVFRFRNTSFSTGAYIFVGATERDRIQSNPDLNQTFELEGEGNSAFKASTVGGDDLLPFYRFQSTITPGTYIFVGESERQGINENFSESFIEEGLAFHLYGAGTGQGVEFNRFQNNENGTYLFAAPEETTAISNDPNLSAVFTNQGVAFEALI